SVGQAKYKNRYKVKLILSYILRKTASRGGLFCCRERSTAIYTLPSRTIGSKTSSGRGGGPPMWRPVLSYSPPWHGHKKASPGFSNLSLSEAVVTLQPRCVQIGDIMRSSPSSERVT